MVGVFLLFSNSVFSQKPISGMDKICESTPMPPSEELPAADLCTENDINLLILEIELSISNIVYLCQKQE